MSQLAEVRFGRFRLHSVQGLFRGEERVPVTPRSLSVLTVLVARAGELVTKEELFRSVWGEIVVSDAALTSCIQELRRVLGDPARAPRFIETQHRRGFRFIGRVRGPTGKQTGLATHSRRAEPEKFVGRDDAARRLARAWSAAQASSRQVVFVTGEAGIGKTTLLEHFLAGVSTRREARICVTGCVERFDVVEAYQPLLEALPRLCTGHDSRKWVDVLRHRAPTWLAQLPGLLEGGESASLQRRTSGPTPERMLRELTDALEALSRLQPIILCVEDLHCCDTPTLDWIASFAHRRDNASILVVCTLRTGEPSAGARTAQSMFETLRLRGDCIEIALSRFDEAAVRDYVEQRHPSAPGAGPAMARLAHGIFRHSEGNPLFVKNILDDLHSRGALVQRAGGWMRAAEASADDLEIPETIRLTIEQQVARLGSRERRLLDAASVSPANCAAAVIAAAAGMTVVEVEALLTPLARRGAFLREREPIEWPDGTVSASYDFVHSLYREVLYARIFAAQRAEFHRQVGVRLESAFGARAPQIAGELAVHFERARELPRAIRYLLHVAETDAGRSAHESAQRHYRHALALIENLPPCAERDRNEAASRIGLAGVLTQLRGWGAIEVEHEYARAQELCERHGAHDLSFLASWNLWVGSIARGQISDAHDRSRAVFDLACCSASPSVRLQGHHALWTTAFARGEFQQVPVHVAAGIALYQPEELHLQSYGSHDPCVCARAFQARAAALCGQPATAARAIEAAVALARRIGHPFTLSFSLMHASAVWLEIGNAQTALVCAAEAGRIAEEQDFSLMRAWTACFRGAAMVELGHPADGIDCMATGIAQAQSTGSDMFLPHFRSLIAGAQIKCARFGDAQQNLDDALALVGRKGERTYLADLQRLRGQLVLAARLAGPAIDVRHEFRVALDTAREQGATLLALKAAMDLSKVLERDGDVDEAKALVAEARAGLAGLPAARDHG